MKTLLLSLLLAFCSSQSLSFLDGMTSSNLHLGAPGAPQESFAEGEEGPEDAEPVVASMRIPAHSASPLRPARAPAFTPRPFAASSLCLRL